MITIQDVPDKDINAAIEGRVHTPNLEITKSAEEGDNLYVEVVVRGAWTAQYRLFMDDWKEGCVNIEGLSVAEEYPF